MNTGTERKPTCVGRRSGSGLLSLCRFMVGGRRQTRAVVARFLREWELTIGELRERTRGIEANVAAVAIENETQRQWMADVFNQEAQHNDTMFRIIADNPDVKLPERRYWPLNHFGEGYQLNGKKH